MERNMERVVSKTRAQNLRYERKFVYSNTSPEDLIATEVLTNSFCFREIFYRRTVNNCYFDDPSMSFYHQNVAGDDKRDKYRLRWYGDDFSKIKKPVLEIKKKHGVVGDKLSFALNEMTLDLNSSSGSTLSKETVRNIEQIQETELVNNMLVLRPSLYNSYERRYFLSHCERFRITIDYNMKFYNPDSIPYSTSEASLPDVVLELKYDIKDDKVARELSQGLYARLSKHSKYVRGIDLIHYQQHN